MNWLNRRLVWVLMAASGTLFFLPLGTRALWNSDEGRYAEIAREMLQLKDWISPHLNYVLYFEKPPLMYWLTAASLAVFGQNEFAARFWCAAFGLLTVWMTAQLGKRWKGERTGLLSGGIVATSFLFFALTQYLVLDMALTFFLTWSLYAASRILSERPPERVRRYTDILALAVAGAIMTKGPIGLLFPVVCLGLTLAYTRLGVQARKISWQPALLLAGLLTAPWFILVSIRHPSFIPFFFLHENVARFLTNVHHRSAPFYFFIPVLLAGFLPWTIFLPKAFRTAFAHRGIAMKRDPVRALLVIWSLFIPIFFSFSQSKLVGYVLPVFPSLALLVGDALEEALDGDHFPDWVARGVAALIFIWIGALAALKSPLSARAFADPAAAVFRAHSDALALMLGLGVFLLVGTWGMRQTLVCVGGVLVAQVLLLSSLSPIAPRLDPYLSNRGLSRSLLEKASPEDRIVGYGVSFENVLQSVPFYTGRRIAVYGDPGELKMGRDLAAKGSDAASTDGDYFAEETEAPEALACVPPGTWMITDEERMKHLDQTGLLRPWSTEAREGKLILLQKS